MLFRIASFLVWAVVAAAAVFWALRLTVRPYPAPPYALSEQGPLLAGADLSRLLGATPVAPQGAPAAPPPEASRFQLAGVVAPRTPESPQGVALIAVDGKPAKPFSVGAKVDGDWVLQSVARRSVALGPAQGAPAVVLEMPVLPEPATGRLSPPLNQ
ncbi:MAG: type II secretion system protein N [Pseudomonadota bacterium]